jgi:hypothetical protein
MYDVFFLTFLLFYDTPFSRSIAKKKITAMSSYQRTPTLLECLPVELLLQIFSLLTSQKVVEIFYGLNQYIDSVIRSITNLSFVVTDNVINDPTLLHIFAIRSTRLVIDTKAIDLTQFINLRSLKLQQGTTEQFDSIRPHHFPVLEILHITTSESQRKKNRERIT